MKTELLGGLLTIRNSDMFIAQIEECKADLAEIKDLVEAQFYAFREQLEEEQAKVKKLREAFIPFLMRKAPCAICGYNGVGYYQKETHPCAKIFHGQTDSYEFARKALEETKV